LNAATVGCKATHRGRHARPFNRDRRSTPRNPLKARHAPKSGDDDRAFAAFLVVGLLFTVYSLYNDIEGTTTWLPFLLLALALLIALGFEFVNGFHDTANAVATVIYTNSLPPMPAVVWFRRIQAPTP
jgi:hypothetical protein